MIDVLAEEATTLPEGAVIRVSRCHSKSAKREAIYTELSARRDDKIVKMRVDNVSPNNIRSYLELCTREITRRRLALATKPNPVAYEIIPSSIAEFVMSMARLDMFIFTAIEPTLQTDESNVTGNKKVPGAGSKASSKRKRKNNNTPTG